MILKLSILSSFGSLFFLFSLILIKKHPLVFFVAQTLMVHFFFNLGNRLVYDWSDYHSTVPSLAIFTFILIEVFSKKENYLKVFILSVLGAVFGMFRSYFTYVFVILVCLSLKKKYWSLKGLTGLLSLFFLFLYCLILATLFSMGFITMLCPNIQIYILDRD